MARVKGALAVVAASAIGVLMTACGGSSGSGTGTNPPPSQYTLTIDSASPASAVQITMSVNGASATQTETTPATVTGAAATTYALTAPATAGGNNFTSWSGCTSTSGTGNDVCQVTLNSNTTVTANYTTPPRSTLTVNTSGASGVSISATPADASGTTSGATPFTLTYNNGTTVTLTAPATAGGSSFGAWTGCTSTTGDSCTVNMTADTTVTATYVPAGSATLTVDSTNPASGVTIAVAPTSVNKATPFPIVAAIGTAFTLTAPATANGNNFSSWTGCTSASGTTCNVTLSANMTVTANYTVTLTGTTVTVDQSSAGPAVTNQILGMNLAGWYDVQTNATAITNAFKAAGIAAVRWPGGSQSDAYHWSTNSVCSGHGYANPNSTFPNFVNDVAKPAGLDLALTANYGSNAACNAGGDPTEAAGWITNAGSLGIQVSHMTIGNEEYGNWEYDLHTTQHDPTTYANSVIGANGYYQLIKSAAAAASENTQVGVIVDANCGTSNGCTPGWDSTVLSTDKGSYDFVEYHYYAENPGSESDSTLLYNAPATFTTNINTIKQELSTAGSASTPIYVGELGSVSSNPGKQSWSITQGLYAGELLGEAMNDNVSRLTWWIGFGNCNGNNGNFASTLYGWQNFGAYNVFADGSGDTGGTNNSPCNYGGPIGTMSPTAIAFQMFSNVAVTGENVLTASVGGSGADTTDVKAYAATHSGGTALVLFNLNETTPEPVNIVLSSSTSTTDMKLITYDKAIYDQTNLTPPVWAAPTTTDLGAQSLPYTLTLQPWSMNVVIIK